MTPGSTGYTVTGAGARWRRRQARHDEPETDNKPREGAKKKSRRSVRGWTSALLRAPDGLRDWAEKIGFRIQAQTASRLDTVRARNPFQRVGSEHAAQKGREWKGEKNKLSLWIREW